MQPQRIRAIGPVVTTVLAMIVQAFVGCSVDDRGPLAPTVEILDPKALVAPTHQPSTAGRKPEAITVVEVTEDIASSSLIMAKDGGVVTAGRHRLTIPPGALKQDMTILLKDVTGTAGFVSCEAYPEGLQFLKPALLESSFRDLKDPFGFTIYWIANPGKSNEDWIDMSANLSGDTQGLAIWLHHFSTYAPGKAGWSPRRGANRHFRSEN